MQRDATATAEASAGFTSRQQEVLTCALALMVEAGDAFSMAAVARRARCSKETIYRWFGDREGLLTATVQWQAAKVRLPELPQSGLTRAQLASALEAFAINWLTVISGEVSAALNRLAIAHAGSGRDGLGRIVLENGPVAMQRRLQPLFERGRAAGLIAWHEGERPLRSFFGLVVADTQIRVLLGDDARPDQDEIRMLAQRAVAQFFRLFGTSDADASANPNPGENDESLL